MDSYELVVFIGAKGAGSGEGEVEGESEVIRVGALYIASCFPYVLASGLLPSSNVIPHGEEAWQVIFHVLFSNCGTYKMYNMYEKQRFSPPSTYCA